jgi:site-specific DNA recombinase
MKLATRNGRHFYLLRGVVRCGVCGRGFRGVSNRRRWFYYQCNSRADADIPNCGNRRVRADELERLIWEDIARFAESPGKVVGLLSKARSARTKGGEGAAASRVERQIAARRRERERVITWARQERITAEEMDAQLAQLRSEIVALEGERERAEDAKKASESVSERLRDAEAFLDELALRVGSLQGEKRAKVVR